MARTGIVLGLTGPFGSGCSTIAKHLESTLKFEQIKLSKYVVEEAQSQGLDSANRLVLQDVGDGLREKNTPAHLAELASKSIDESADDTDFVIDGIRNTGEAQYLQQRYANFYLVAVQASEDSRWKRTHAKFNGNLNDFQLADKRDQDEESATGQQVRGCTDIADVVVQNDVEVPLGTHRAQREFFYKVDDYVSRMRDPGSHRPLPNEAAMALATDMSLLSMCIGRQVGAAITDESDVVLALGFNDTPVPPMQDVGDTDCLSLYGQCFRKHRRSLRTCPNCGEPFDDGLKCTTTGCDQTLAHSDFGSKELDLCRAIHAEERAILQLARNPGPSPMGGRLYTTTFPCMLCAKKIVEIGIKEVVYIDPYPVPEAKLVLEDGGVTTTPFEGARARGFHRLYRRPWNWEEKVLKKQ